MINENSKLWIREKPMLLFLLPGYLFVDGAYGPGLVANM